MARVLVMQATAFETLLNRGLFGRIGWQISVDMPKDKEFPQMTIWDIDKCILEDQPVTPEYLGELVSWAYRSDIAEMIGYRKLELMVRGLIAESQIGRQRSKANV